MYAWGDADLIDRIRAGAVSVSDAFKGIQAAKRADREAEQAASSGGLQLTAESVEQPPLLVGSVAVSGPGSLRSHRGWRMGILGLAGRRTPDEACAYRRWHRHVGAIQLGRALIVPGQYTPRQRSPIRAESRAFHWVTTNWERHSAICPSIAWKGTA